MICIQKLRAYRSYLKPQNGQLPRGKGEDGKRIQMQRTPKMTDRRAELKVKDSGCFKEGKQSSTRPNEAERSSKIFRSS